MEWRQCMKKKLGKIDWEVGKQGVEMGFVNKLMNWARSRGICLVFLHRNYSTGKLCQILFAWNRRNPCAVSRNTIWGRKKKLDRKWKRARNDVRGWMGRKSDGWGIQSGGSSWAKKMVVLRTEICVCGCSTICSLCRLYLAGGVLYELLGEV